MLDGMDFVLLTDVAYKSPDVALAFKTTSFCPVAVAACQPGERNLFVIQNIEICNRWKEVSLPGLEGATSGVAARRA